MSDNGVVDVVIVLFILTAIVDEIANGTDPNDPNAGAMKPLTVTAAQGSIKMGFTDKDALRISGVVNALPANFSTDGKAVLLNVGGAMGSFTLNAKPMRGPKSFH